MEEEHSKKTEDRRMAWKGYEGLAEGYQGRWQTEDRTQIYVSNHGDDGWDGSEGRPVRSIEKAAMLARAAVREDGRGVNRQSGRGDLLSGTAAGVCA